MHLMMANKSLSTSSIASPSLLDGKTLKKEIPDVENIKEFAETAMNELLGWYGYDTRGSRAGPIKPPAPGTKSPANNEPSQISTKSPSAEENDVCAWCNNSIPNDSNPLHQSMGDKFCSEICFSQSRRANFKRAKTCDWCRHIRHTVSYVDFQDGVTQLQFCSDKCLNQYKMHIFCRETQAHLDLNPHLVNSSASNNNLITPELWMKNCRSRSVSPSSEHSTSPVGGKISMDDVPLSPKPNLNSLSEVSTSLNNVTLNSIKPALPLITVAPTSKLMKAKPMTEEKVKLQTASDLRREHKAMKVYSKRRRSSRCSSTVTSQNYVKHANNNIPPVLKPQDLTIRSPSLSQDSSPNSSTMHTPQSLIPSPPLPLNPRIPNFNSSNFPNLNLPPPHPTPPFNPIRSPRGFRHFFHQQNYTLPRPPAPTGIPSDQTSNDFPPSLQQLGIGPPPPVTILVPYPVILPLPLPIPVPIPIMNFAKAYENNKWTKDETSNKKTTNPSDDTIDSFTEEPIDFTMTTKRKHNNNIEAINKNNKSEMDDSLNDKEDNDTTVDSENTECEFSGHLETTDSGNAEQTLPKFKITRLGAKMAKIVLPKTREISESTRPLRKRRRIVVEVPAEDDSSNVSNNKSSRQKVHV